MKSIEDDRNIYVIDIESSGLYPNYGSIWTIVIKQINSSRSILKLNPFKESGTRKKILDYIFATPNPVIVGHNILGFDMWCIWKEYDLNFEIGPDLFDGKPVTFIDTLYLSQYLLPDREDKHSLKSWGKRVGDNKIDFYDLCVQKGVIPKGSPKGSEFKQWIPEMDEYCIQDVEVTEKTYLTLIKELDKHNTYNAFKNGLKGFWLMNAQSFTGFKFDQKYAQELKAEIEERIQRLREEVEPLLPPRKLKKTEQNNYIFPSIPYKKDGSYSANMIKFFEKHDVKEVDGGLEIYGDFYEIIPKQKINITKPISLDDQNELKEFFVDQGWIPTYYNYKTNQKTKKKIRDENNELILTTPKIQEQGKICPNLLELEGEIAKKVVQFLSLKNRYGTLNGWLKDERLLHDGRISAGASGIASTHRMKHTKIVNVPKAEDGVILGREFRSLWISQDGFKIVAVDQSALEARVQGNYLFSIDNGKSARELIDGDVHSKNCKAFYPVETASYDINSPDFDKDDKGFKPYRSKSKNGYYAIIYGCSAKKLGSTLGKDVQEGKQALENFWSVNPALKRLKTELEKFWIEKGDKKWIPAIDGRRLYSRSQHSLINLLFQNAGAVIMDYSLILLHNKFAPLKLDDLGRPYYLYKDKIVRRIGYWHDETEFEVEDEIAEEVREILEWAMIESGKVLKLNIELKGEAKIGLNWSQTH